MACAFNQSFSGFAVMKLDFQFLQERAMELRCAEVCTFVNPRPIIVRGISATLRERKGLACSITEYQDYLRLESVAGIEAWHGPFIHGSRITAAVLAAVLGLVGAKTSIAHTVEALGPVWRSNASACSAVEAALWDLACRMEELPLWRLLRPNGRMGYPEFYGSVLGFAPEDVDVLFDVIAAGNHIAKWTINPCLDIAAQIQKLRALGIPWRSIALDAHGGLDLAQAESIHRCAPSLAWLEDPFTTEEHPGWSSSGLPPLVVGEHFHSTDALLRVAMLPAVYMINLEVEQLGITHACKVFAELHNRGLFCLMHGRSMILSSHLAVAFPEVIRSVESHLTYLPERMATVFPEESEFSPRRIANNTLTHAGCGAEPAPTAQLIAREEVFNG
jgi:L-alanine-DL-glutamate epimerase-like enolase superfamily enzyme